MHESVSELDAGVAALTGLISVLRDLPAGTDGAVLIDQIRALEELKSAAAATQAQARPGPGGRIDLITPTGHRYTSRPPALPRSRTPSPLEREIVIHLWRTHTRPAA
ncbi:MAG TPA: hypothetical protein VFE40_09480 [Jatrophihabitantaceae bacterium]|jgi:hypothetical protein|nr:hypothetical protein [Jatrophihabitantaceae bacterium]